MRILLPILLSFVGFILNAQVVYDSVSMEANYTQQVFYSLDNGVVSSVDNNDWELGFAVSGRGAEGSAIIVNEGNTTLWIYPGDTSDWLLMDTSGHESWDRLLNSDTSWTNGALNKYRGSRGVFDMGWGTLNPQNNFWTFGDFLYLAKIGADTYKKLTIVSLKTGVWEFKYADLDGSNENTIIIDKLDYENRNFAYHSMLSNETLDREPDNSAWDFMFAKHQDEVAPDLIIPVTSVFNNKKLWTAKANVTTYNEASTRLEPITDFSQNINNIGREWKKFSSQSGWAVYDTIAYFVYDRDSSDFYRIVFTDFGGRGTGKAFFDKELLRTVDIPTVQGSIPVTIYPNPATSYTAVLIDYPSVDLVNIEVIDMTGKRAFVDQRMLTSGVNLLRLDLGQLSSGWYVISLSNDEFKMNSKLIIK